MKKSFTLAEVLITLGVIGIIAAMTLPALIAKYQQMVLINMWKKHYASLQNAFSMVLADNDYSLGVYDNVNHNNRDLIIDIVKKMNVTLDCGTNISKICGNGTSFNTGAAANAAVKDFYKSTTGQPMSGYALKDYQAVLNTGANLYARAYTPDYKQILIDVNGFNKKPNILGKDLFGVTIIISQNKMLPWGADGTGLIGTCPNGSKMAGNKLNYGFDDSGTDLNGAECSAEYLLK